MLAADKDRLVAGLKQHALHLRQKELEYYVERYSNITTQASILAGFAFDSLVELDIPEKWMTERSGVCTVYYIAASLTMAFALYTVCVASFATVYGHRLALQGPTGSVDRAVAVLMKQRNTIFVTFGIAMVCLIVAAVSMAWVKMDHTGNGETPAIITGIFVFFFIALVWKHQDMKGLFNIPAERMVQGDVRVNLGANEVDIAQLEAGFGPHNETHCAVRFQGAHARRQKSAPSGSHGHPWAVGGLGRGGCARPKGKGPSTHARTHSLLTTQAAP
tara:strand:+ start:191 stop:1015 length:825 start_codon:yes stop_codon:yes gene_type:complete